MINALSIKYNKIVHSTLIDGYIVIYFILKTKEEYDLRNIKQWLSHYKIITENSFKSNMMQYKLLLVKLIYFWCIWTLAICFTLGNCSWYSQWWNDRKAKKHMISLAENTEIAWVYSEKYFSGTCKIEVWNSCNKEWRITKHLRGQFEANLRTLKKKVTVTFLHDEPKTGTNCSNTTVPKSESIDGFAGFDSKTLSVISMIKDFTRNS